MVRSNINSQLNDADLAKRVGIAFATRPRVTWLNIKASVQDGVVTLEGEVPTNSDRQLVVALTRHVAGVFGVEDSLAVAEAKAPSANQNASQKATAERFAKRQIWHVLRAGAAAFVIAAIAMTGCNKKEVRIPVHPVTGSIAFRGQPTNGAFVSLHPKDGVGTGAPSPRATVGPDGKFTLTTYESQDGAPEGDYVLTVQWYKPVRDGNEVVGGPNVIPVKYGTAKTSDLVVKVAAGDNQLKPIQLR